MLDGRMTEVAAMTDPAARAEAAGEEIDRHQEAIAEWSRIRRVALEQMIASGLSQTQIAMRLDMTRGRVSQLLSAGVRPERAFYGTGPVTVAIGAKRETNRADPSDVISAESFAAFEALAASARRAGLDASYEVVGAPGNVRLNRPNLIVLTNPRLLPFLGQVMEADPHLRWIEDGQGRWYIVDLETHREFRSPRDAGEPADFGYLGRLPRPDGHGTFLYLAGTHAPGTLGAAMYLTEHLGPLWKELRTKRFSAVTKFEYAESDQTRGTVELVTPLYRHDG